MIAVDLTALFHQRRRPIIVVVVILVLALVLEGGFYLGQHAAYSGIGARPKTYRATQEELISVQDTLRSRDAALAIQLARHEVDRQALELVRKELVGQQQDIAGLEESLGFYRSLMSPGKIATGLSLRGLDLMAGDQPRQYFYRIVVQQEARRHEQLKGSLSVVISGVMDGERVEYSLAELGEDFGDEGVALEFRYFQSVEGQLVLPEGFKPGNVRVDARTLEPHQFEAREEYPWQLEERFTHVGK